MLKGHVDEVNHRFITGWAVDTDDPDGCVEILIFIGGHLHATVTCDLPRADLAGIEGFGRGAHAFRFEFASELNAQSDHRISVVFMVNGTPLSNGHRLLLGRAQRADLLPILVTAPGRSGTTLLMGRLGQQPEICVGDHAPHELRMLSYYAAAYRVLTARADHNNSTDPDHIEKDKNFFGSNPFYHDTFRRVFSSNLEFIRPFSGMIPHKLAEMFREITTTFYRSLACDQKKAEARFFAEKNNNVSQNVREFVRFTFGEVKELILIRDPRDILCSHKSYFGSALDKAFGEISQASKTLLSFRNQDARDVRFVIYEELVQDPDAALRRIAEFLNLDLARPLNPDREDRVFKVHATTDSPIASIGRWRRDLSVEMQERCNDTWRDFLSAFGYR